LRFKVPQGTVWVDDLLRGRVSFENRLISDFIILKSDGTPTYNFACVIDDSLMKITHIIRGDEHLPNTPRQVLLYHALDFLVPRFAHVPLILGRDSSKLSKRHGATSVSYYREQGYLPWTVVNYLVLLGWSTSDSQQFFDRDELIHKFTLERVGKSAAIFDPAKLEWMNGEYIRRMDPDELANLLIPYLRQAHYIDKEVGAAMRQKILKVARLEQERIKVLSQIVDVAGFFFTCDFAYDPISVEKRLKKDYVPSLLEEVRLRIETLSPFEEKGLEELLRRLAEDFSLSHSEVFHPLRVALTGKMKGPGLFELAELLGKDETIKRIGRTLEMLRTGL
jgi:glutamyl-tRNA synthetase